MNGLTLLAVIALAIGVVFAYRAGVLRGRRDSLADSPHPLSAAAIAAPATAPAEPERSAPPPEPVEPPSSAIDAERARLVRASERERTRTSARARALEAEVSQLRDLAEDRRALYVAIAQSRAETARYRQLVVDVENAAPSAFLGGPGSADDLKLIVGVGPMLERMLHQLGVTTFRQIAHWTERDIDDFERRLPEFPGRIRRDAWATQARELHLSKYGSAP